MIVAWAGRATRLTPARFDELAELALPAVGGSPSDAARGPAQATQRLLGVAQWLVGRR